MAARRRARGSLFRRTRNGKPEQVWSISYRSQGKRITERAFTDKAASEQLLAEKLRQAARDQVGIGDPFRKHRGRPLTDHLKDFCDGIAGRARTAKHERQMRARLQRAFDGMGAARIADLDLSKAETWLGSLLKAPRQKDDPPAASVKTRDHYALALRQFGLWLLDTDRAPVNPFHRLHSVAKPGDITRERLALTAPQVLALADAAEIRPQAKYRKLHPQARPEAFARLAERGRLRGLLYLFSALTGLRRAECAGIRWCDLDLGPEPLVTARASATKNKKREPIPFGRQLADRLEQHRRDLAKRTGRLPAGGAAVFAVPKNLPEQLRKDALYANVPTVDDTGRRLDFHALRATYVTLASRAGVAQQLAQRLARHADPKLTAKHYEKLGLADLRVGSDQLSDFFWREGSAAPVAATDSPNMTQHGAPRHQPADVRRTATE